MKWGIKNWSMVVAALLLSSSYTANAATKKLLIGSFENVVIDGDMEVNIITGKTPSAIATGDRRILDLLRADRQSDTVRIRVQRPVNNDNAIRITEPLIVTLTNRNVRNITLRGNAKLKINSINQNDASRIYMTGGGEIIIDQLNSDKLNVNLYGTGKLAIGSGIVRNTRLEIDGASTYDAANLKTRNFDLIQNGNATTIAQVEDVANLSNNGAGRISITGKAECFITKAGFGIISCPRDKKTSGTKKR